MKCRKCRSRMVWVAYHNNQECPMCGTQFDGDKNEWILSTHGVIENNGNAGYKIENTKGMTCSKGE